MMGRTMRGMLAVTLMLGLFAVRAEAASPEAPEVVLGFYASLLQIMRQGPALGASGRYDRLEPVVRTAFDMTEMTRLAVGPGWASLAPAERQRVTAAFEHYVAATYADRFDSWSGQRFEVTGQKDFGPGVVVQTRIVKANGEPVTIDYLMRHGPAGWRISDIYLDGSISELATRRSEFAAILRDQGIDGLIAALNRKSEFLSGSAASPS
jgi:phospholipid transport system substrate-binding protein